MVNTCVGIILIIHARGHAPAQVGLFLKNWLGLKLIFDFRGLWVDERVDKGGWNLSKTFDLLQYTYYKRIERKLLRQADQVIVLTESVVKEILRLGARPASKVTVIPCCADFNHFALADEIGRQSARIKLGIAKDALVLGYLGSVGSMYMVDRFFRFVELAAFENQYLRVLAITPDVERFNMEMHKHLPSKLHHLICILTSTRDKVPKLLSAIDLLVSFISPSYARIATSPTKLAESFAVGVPAICNYGVGDVESLMQELDSGLMVNEHSDDALSEAVKALPFVTAKGGKRLREAAFQRLGLEVAVKRYRSVYIKLDSLC